MDQFLGVGLAVVGAVGAAGQAVAIRLAMRRGRMADVLLVNMGVTAVVLVALTAVFVPEPVVTPTSVAAFSASGLVSVLAGRAFLFLGIRQIGASRAEPIKASTPLYATAFAVVLLGERVTGPQVVGISLVVAGVAIVSLEGMNADRLAGEGVSVRGASLPMAAALLFGLEPVFASIGFREGTAALLGGAIMTAFGSLALLSYLCVRRSVPRPGSLPPGEGRWYVLSGLASAVSILGYYGGLSVARVGVVVPIVQTSPLLVVAFSAVFLRDLERITPRLVAGAVVIIGGAVLVSVTG
jgi:uncharacterized membrane protein